VALLNAQRALSTAVVIVAADENVLTGVFDSRLPRTRLLSLLSFEKGVVGLCFPLKKGWSDFAFL
jgi:hypothetical protein